MQLHEVFSLPYMKKHSLASCMLSYFKWPCTIALKTLGLGVFDYIFYYVETLTNIITFVLTVRKKIQVSSV